MTRESMSLIAQLARRPVRESSGARSANRFDYQKDWALCKLLDLHEKDEDYLLICEFHEDLMVLDASVDPTQVEFYQVKTDQSKKWTVVRLVSRPKGKKGGRLPSILGKLFQNCLGIEAQTAGLYFVSNAPFNIKLRDEDDPSGRMDFTASDLAEEELDKLVNALTSELGAKPDEDSIQLVSFERSWLDKDGHAKGAMGHLAEFIDRRRPEARLQIPAAYRALIGEVRRRTNAEYSSNDFEEISRKKGLSRNQFSEMLKVLVPESNPEKVWAEASRQLSIEGLSFQETHRIRASWQRYEVERMDPANETLNALRQKICQLVEDFLGGSGSESLTSFCRRTEAALRNGDPGAALPSSKIWAMTIWELYEEQRLSEAREKPKEEEE